MKRELLCWCCCFLLIYFSLLRLSLGGWSITNCSTLLSSFFFFDQSSPNIFKLYNLIYPLSCQLIQKSLWIFGGFYVEGVCGPLSCLFSFFYSFPYLPCWPISATLAYYFLMMLSAWWLPGLYWAMNPVQGLYWVVIPIPGFNCLVYAGPRADRWLDQYISSLLYQFER